MATQDPTHPAIVGRNGNVTYGELERSANRLAQLIVQERGSGAEPVGVLVEHGAAAVVTILAVLKAGKFYVPLDPLYPRDRLRYMLDDTKATLIVTDQAHQVLASELADGGTLILTTDERASVLSERAPELSIGPESIAAIYYTSGSTGRPKGIIYTHRYLLRNMMTYGRTFHVSVHDRWTWLHSCSFAAGSTDVFCTLLHGATLCPWHVQKEGLTGFGDWLADVGVTVLHWIPTAVRSFVATLNQPRVFSEVRLMILGSEKFLAH
ncbi:MAG: AMP-binding protein, partial [Planctomycetes bacterium]|nr:AMP-binding protein [Planctomycetota bacterium]